MSKNPEQVAQKIMDRLKNNARKASSVVDNNNLIVRNIMKAFKLKNSITVDDLIELLEKEAEEEKGELGKIRVEEAIKLLLSLK